MTVLFNKSSVWLTEWMKARKIALWGVADLRDFSTPRDETKQGFPFAVSWAVPMNPLIMISIQKGPNEQYANEYAHVNRRINQLSEVLSSEFKVRGFRSKPLGVSDRTDKINIMGDFPHKTAATRAGLGWVGRHCQLVTRRFGSWIRLGTVFTDMKLLCAKPVARQFCGICTRCVQACPAKALKGTAWYPGIPREEILDVKACDQWKKEHYLQYHKGHNCGICSAVCPYGLKVVSIRRDNELQKWMNLQ